MYKIKYLVTGHEFLLPDETAKELKEKFPNDYKITEKNGKKFTDKKTVIKFKDGSIRELVVDELHPKIKDFAPSSGGGQVSI